MVLANLDLKLVLTEEVVDSKAYDRPQPYNDEPARHPRDQEQTWVRRNNIQRREIELWCKANQ